MKLTCDVRFGGHRLVLDARGALWWPALRVLAVSDLHLEKATFLGLHGSLIAPYDTLDTLDRLEALIAYYQPEEVVFLGDSFHDKNAWERLDDTLKRRIVSLSPSIRWIEGNHDISLRAEGLPAFEADYVREGLRFAHDKVEGSLPHIIGHYHPKITVSSINRRFSGRCFAYTERILLMPAFGSFTGGLDLHHAAFRQLLQDEEPQPFLLHNNAIYKVPYTR